MMRADPPRDDGRPLPLEENDPVWRLLAQTPLSEPDAWFTVRTLARCRHEGLATEGRSPLWSRVWRWTLATGVGVCVALFAMTELHEESALSKQKSVQEAFEIMASLEPDSDSSSPSSTPSWQDSSL